MAPKTRKKDGPAQASMKQMKLNFKRTIKASTSAPLLTQVLSQYQTMRMITEYLSSADIANLAATNKVHRSYIMDGEHILRQMKFFALCDGKGMEARARCFGHFKGDVKNATVKCMEKNGIPCDGCRANVCNNCRFHVDYYDIPCCQDDMFHYEEHELQYANTLDSIRACHQDCCDECPNFHSGNFPIEAIRAVHLAGEPRQRHFCNKDACKPSALEDAEIWEFLLETEDAENWCCCDISTQFVDDCWLCIPCFIKEEAKACKRRTSRNVYLYDKKKKDGKTVVTRELLKTEFLCDCGEVANIPYYVECRWCDMPVRPHNLDDILDDI